VGLVNRVWPLSDRGGRPSGQKIRRRGFEQARASHRLRDGNRVLIDGGDTFRDGGRAARQSQNDEKCPLCGAPDMTGADAQGLGARSRIEGGAMTASVPVRVGMHCRRRRPPRIVIGSFLTGKTVRLGANCPVLRKSWSWRGSASGAVRSQAEPGNEGTPNPKRK